MLQVGFTILAQHWDNIEMLPGQGIEQRNGLMQETRPQNTGRQLINSIGIV